jgi:hypothetical protein
MRNRISSHLLLLLLLVLIFAVPVVVASTPTTGGTSHRFRRNKLWSLSPRNPKTQNDVDVAESSSSPSATQHGATDNEEIMSDVPSLETKDEEDAASHWKNIRRRRRGPTFEMIPLRPKSSPEIRQSSSAAAAEGTAEKAKKKPASPRAPLGTTFDLRRPTPERIARWFAPVDHYAGSSSSSRRKRRATAHQLFNHDSVGMTNPVLHVSLTEEDNLCSHVEFDTASSATTISLASSSSATNHDSPEFELQDTWIPATAGSNAPRQAPTRQQQQQQHSSSSSQNDRDAEAEKWARVLQYRLKPHDSSRQGAEKAWWPATKRQVAAASRHGNSQKDSSGWRQLCYRRRVGKGQACYERVREAALEWQFDAPNSTKGILPVIPQRRTERDSSSTNNNKCFSLDEETSQHVQPIWAGPYTQGSRRLVTFTTLGFRTKWLPKLYTFNPVMVVYDLLDQRYVL